MDSEYITESLEGHAMKEEHSDDAAIDIVEHCTLRSNSKDSMFKGDTSKIVLCENAAAIGETICTEASARNSGGSPSSIQMLESPQLFKGSNDPSGVPQEVAPSESDLVKQHEPEDHIPDPDDLSTKDQATCKKK